jgi:septum formation protein
MDARLVLASASPRRRELLARLERDFEVVTSDLPETPHAGEAADAFVQRMARNKAIDVARRRAGDFVLGADTVVVVDGTIFGKPVDRDDARRMLRALSGRTHRVVTAVALADPTGRVEEIVVRTQVEFRELARGEIEEYLDSGEPFDKAGAYAVQGQAGKFVRRISGSRSNVVGLPLDEVRDLLRRHLRTAAHPLS